MSAAATATAATSAVDDIKLEDIQVDDIDFTDLENEYKFEDDFSFDQYIVVTGAPVIPESKVAVLKKALGNLFSKVGKVVNMEFPIDEETKKTKGFLFVECGSAEDAKKIIKAYHTKRLDLKHRLFIYSMNDVEKFNSEDFSTEFKEPQIPEFVPSSSLHSWLLDEDGRDQFVVQDDITTTIVWNTRFEDKPAKSIAVSRDHWSTNYVRFSPKGTYLFSYHTQGVTAWGGSDFARLRRFYHPKVRTSAVSPNEKYLVTFSVDPISVHGDVPESQFTVKNDGHNICIWEIATGLLCATFPFVKTQYTHWPLIRWAYNDKYCARMVGENLIVHDCENGFAPMLTKGLKVSGIRDFSFAPTGVKIQPFRNGDEPSVLLSYWTPETNNMSCKATVVEVPRGRVLKTVNLVQVSNVNFHWQDKGEFLCFNVERHTKSKKTEFSTLEICKLTEKDIPVEKIEMKEHVMEFAWEPQGKKFITIGIDEETMEDNISLPQHIVGFYAPEKRDPKKDARSSNVVSKWKLVKKLDKKFFNTISWSPAGRFVALATLLRPNSHKCEVEFYDTEFKSEKNLNETDDVMASLKEITQITSGAFTDMTWDPSGRFLVCWSNSMKHKNKLDHGYKMYNVAGELLKDENVPGIRNFAWRPRPESKLTAAEKKKVKKNLKEWSAQFEEQDLMQADTAARDLILKQRAMLAEWREYRKESSEAVEKEFGYSTFDIVAESSTGESTSIEEIKEEIIEETREKVE